MQDKEFEMEENVVYGASFSVCGPSQNAVDQTRQWLEKFISEEQTSHHISDPLILSLSDKDQQCIKELQRTLDVVVKKKMSSTATAADSEGLTLTVEGLSRDVLKATSEIQTMLQKIRNELELQKDIELASELVDWQYKQNNQFNSFDQKTNYYLEQALLNNVAQVDITFKGLVYKVTIPDGPAVSSGNQMVIKRIDRRGITN